MQSQADDSALKEYGEQRRLEAARKLSEGAPASSTKTPVKRKAYILGRIDEVITKYDPAPNSADDTPTKDHEDYHSWMKRVKEIELADRKMIREQEAKKQQELAAAQIKKMDEQTAMIVGALEKFYKLLDGFAGKSQSGVSISNSFNTNP